MKIFQKFGFGLAFILAFAVLAIAQTEKEKSSTSNKIAVINLEMFKDKEKGIKELVEAYAKLFDEFKPQIDERDVLVGKYIKLGKEIEELNKQMNKSVGICWDYRGFEKMIQEFQSLEVQIKKLQESAITLFKKRESEVISPIKIKINEALIQFANENGYEEIFDLSVKLLSYPDFGKPDITDEFITYYNSLSAKQQ